MSLRITGSILVLAGAAAVGFFLAGGGWPDAVGARAPEGLAVTRVYPEPRALPDFSLERPDGRPFTLADWRGRWNLVFIGFTHCPDICPVALGTLRDVERRFPPERAPQVTFISVDPERDRGETLGRYVGFFNPRFLAATGDHETLQRLTRALGLIYLHRPAENGYEVDHSASIVIVDPDGRLVGAVPPPHDPAAIAADLERLMGG
jgi:protein SCO1/2